MGVDKKISQLSTANELLGNDAGVIARDGNDYQFQLSTLLSYIQSSIQSGAVINFGTVLPQNTTGKNGDLFINTADNSFGQKVSGTWITKYQPINTGSGNTVIYNTSLPISSIGIDGDTYVNTTTGIFFKKADGAWVQVFSMLNGPAGPRGPKGDTGEPGVDGRTILSGTTDPSNLSTGVDGDFYLNTNTDTLFGPKTAGNWGSGTLIGGASSFAELEGNPTDNTLLADALNAKFDNLNLYDNVDSTSITKALTANQGNKLQTQITNLSNALVPHPSYTQPSADLSSPQNGGAYEIGQSLSVVLSLGFSQNHAGAYTSWAIKKNGADVKTGSNTGLPTGYTDAIAVTTSSPSYVGVVSYGQGPVLNNIIGIPDGTGRIGANTKFSVTLNGFYGSYRLFYGPCAAAPGNRTDAIALTNQLTSSGSVFTLNTGTTQLYMAILIPPNKTLTQVTDLDAQSLVITSEYLHQPDITVNDAGGNPVTGYKLYLKTLGVPYSINHRHQFTIS